MNVAVNKDRRASLNRTKQGVFLGIFLSISADSATPAIIREIEPSGGCSV